MPFYGNVKQFGKIVKDLYICELNDCKIQSFRKCIVDLNIKVAFSIHNSLALNLNKQQV